MRKKKETPNNKLWMVILATGAWYGIIQMALGVSKGEYQVAFMALLLGFGSWILFEGMKL